MTKQRLQAVVIIGLLLSNVALIVFIMSKKAPEHPPRGLKHVQRLIEDKLRFNSEQKKAYDKQVKVHQRMIFKQYDDISNVRTQLYQLLIAPSNEDEKTRLIEVLGRKHMALESLQFNHFAEIKTLCKSDEQIKYFENLVLELPSLFDPKMKKKK